MYNPKWHSIPPALETFIVQHAHITHWETAIFNTSHARFELNANVEEFYFKDQRLTNHFQLLSQLCFEQESCTKRTTRQAQAILNSVQCTTRSDATATDRTCPMTFLPRLLNAKIIYGTTTGTVINDAFNCSRYLNSWLYLEWIFPALQQRLSRLASSLK